MVAERIAAREIVWLGEPSSDVRELVGGKVAPLSRLATRHRVPPGFCLTTLAFKRATVEAEGPRVPAGLQERISEAYRELGESVVGGIVTPDTYVVDTASGTIVQRLLSEKRRMTVAVAGDAGLVRILD
jgi:phosphoenolpyruvate synthase/pyruvate phosphate dikinase